MKTKSVDTVDTKRLQFLLHEITYNFHYDQTLMREAERTLLRLIGRLVKRQLKKNGLK